MEKLTDQILHDVIKPRPEHSFKGTFGTVTLVGGNRNFGGAIIMAATTAVKPMVGKKPILKSSNSPLWEDIQRASTIGRTILASSAG